MITEKMSSLKNQMCSHDNHGQNFLECINTKTLPSYCLGNNLFSRYIVAQKYRPNPAICIVS